MVVADVFGWIALSIGIALTIGGLALTARALWITHDSPTWPEVSPRGAVVVRKIRGFIGKRPPTIAGTLHAATGTITIGPPVLSAFGTVRRPITDDDSIETKVDKLIENLGQLEEALNHQAGRQRDRLASIENTISTHSKDAAALEGRVSLDQHEERTRKARALPAEALGLAGAAFGQFLALVGTILLAL